MSQFLFQYHAVSITTWIYLSSLLMIALFFKFSRLWSVRNLDLLMLILLAPGMLMIHYGQLGRLEAQHHAGGTTTDGSEGINVQQTLTVADDDQPAEKVEGDDPVVVIPPKFQRREILGYLWLLVAAGLWLIRILLDTRLTRRPLLSPNLSPGGMTFMGVALFVFLMANVIKDRQITSPESSQELSNARLELISSFDNPEKKGPGYALLDTLPDGLRKSMAILSHVAIVIGIVLVAYRHFGNTANGIGAATLYLMLPYTSQLTGQVAHFLPAAFLIWALFCYRRPILAGVLVGAAIGCIYYPLFLLPLWLGFYWHRGAFRFLLGVSIALVTLMIVLRLLPGSQNFLGDVQRMFGILLPEMERDSLEGIWSQGGWDPMFRLPALVGSAVLSFSFLLWPAQKNLATLIACTAGVMVASQFWHGYGGGLFLGWYVPIILLMIFRPNLEDRVAQTMLSEGGFGRKRVAT